MTALRTADVPIIRAVVWWLGLAQAILAGLVASTAFMGLHLAVPGTVATLMAVLAAAQAYLEKTIQRQVTSNKDVVEAVDGGTVKAGPANEYVAEGHTVRSHGTGDLPQGASEATHHGGEPPASIPPSG